MSGISSFTIRKRSVYRCRQCGGVFRGEVNARAHEAIWKPHVVEMVFTDADGNEVVLP